MYASQFMTSLIIPQPFALLYLEKCGKQVKKLQKIEYLENEKSFLRWNKKHFSVFEGLSFGEQIKIW